MYLRNAWYVAAWSHEVSAAPLARTMLDDAIVVWRTEGGEVAALEDRCPHRQLPLSMGSVAGETLQCGYHGMRFAADGRCVAVPSQTAVPPKARVRTYPAVERYGWVWLWMGDAAADEDLIPDFGQLTDPAYAAVGKTNHVKANYQLVTDNLMDLSHVGYVHTTTIGTSDFTAKGKLVQQRTPRGVAATLTVPEVPQPPLYIKSGVLPEGEPIDRWAIMDFVAPCFVTIRTGGAPVGSGALEGNYDRALNLWVLNAMTPETARTTNYFWASVRSHALGDKQADAMFFAGVSEAFEEDKRVLEAQQAAIDRRGFDDWSVALKGDAASIEARRVLDRMIAAEAQGHAVAAE